MTPDLKHQLNILKRILKYVKPYKGRLILGMFAGIVAGLFGFSPVLLLKYLFDTVIPREKIEYLYAFCAFLILIYLIKGIASYAQSYLMAWVGQHVIMDLRNITFSHVVNLPLRFFRSQKLGELLSRILSDIGLMEVAVSRVLGTLIMSFFRLFPPIIYVFYASWKLAIIAVFILPLALYPIVKFAKKLKKVSLSGQQQLANLTATMSESFYGIHVIKAFTMERFQYKRFRKFNRDYYNAMMKAARVSALSPPLMEMLGAIAAAVVFGLGLRSVIKGEMTQGTLLAFLTSLFVMYDPIKRISRLNYDIQRAAAGAERIFELLDRTSDILESKTPVEATSIRGHIKMEHVTFAYDDGEVVLSDIDLEIKPGQTLAIVGTSGVGKSTLVNLLPRFFEPTKGRILLDGVDIRDYSLASLRNQIGVVTQETILFNDTVFNNLCYGRQDIPRERVIEAAKTAFAHDFIEKLPKGYETVIGDRGVTLSGGQRQRLAIARALIKNPPLLILDEATSSLDSESEKMIQEAIENLVKDRTTIIIAHRLSTIRKADFIIVMQKGRIVEMGTHSELMTLNGEYRYLHDIQNR